MNTNTTPSPIVKPRATTTVYPPDRVTDRTAEWRRKSMGLTARPRGENLETCFQPTK